LGDVEAIEETRPFLILSDDKASNTFGSKRLGIQESEEQVETFASCRGKRRSKSNKKKSEEHELSKAVKAREVLFHL